MVGGPLRDWAETLLDERRLRTEGFFNPTPIRAMWREHLAGHGPEQALVCADVSGVAQGVERRLGHRCAIEVLREG